MKLVLITFILAFGSSISHAEYLMPGERPKVDLSEAIKLCEKFYTKDSYIDRAILYSPNEMSRVWVIYLASPTKGYTNLVVSMDATVSVADKDFLKNLKHRTSP